MSLKRLNILGSEFSRSRKYVRMSQPYREFIRLNLATLLSGDSHSEEWKRLKHDYFVVRHRKRLGVPRNPELAAALLKYCIETGVARNPERFNELIQKSSFLTKHLHPKEREGLLASLDGKPTSDTLLTSEELRQIHHEEYRKQKETELAAAAHAQVEARLAEVEALRRDVQHRYDTMLAELEQEKKKFAQEQAAADEAKSALDSYIDTPMDQIPYTESQQRAGEPTPDRIVWWDRLGLTASPFPTVDGLSEISEVFHDEIVLRIPVFQYYHDLVRSSPTALLGKTHVITGEFGCGKTTLFDFLKKPLITHDLLPLHLILDAESDSDSIRRSFYKSIVHEISPSYQQETGQHPLSLYPTIEKEEIADFLRTLLNARHLNGVIAMIDGLHKNDDYRAEAIGFIQSLQNTQDYWNRAGVRVGVLIAGSKAWELDLSLNAVTRGTVDHFERIGTISASDSFEMLSRRLRAFSKDQSRPARVRRPAVERVCKQLQAKYPRDLTFRDVVEEIQPYLERTDSGFVEISLPFDKTLLAKLRESVNSFPPFAEAISRLRKRPDAFLPGLQLLSVLLEKTRIGESQKIFKENESLFAILAKAGLIQNVKPSRVSEYFWVPSRAVLDFGKKSELEVGYPPSEFLYEIFLDRPEDRVSTSESFEVELARRLVATFSTADPALSTAVNASLERHLPILEHAMTPTDLIARNELCARTSESVELVLKALYLAIEPRTRPLFKGATVRAWLADSWNAPPEVFEFWRELSSVGDICPDTVQAATLVRAYLRAYRSTISAVEKSIRDDSIVNLRTAGLRRIDKVTLNDARSHYSDGLFFDCTRIYTDYAEARIREFTYNVLSLKFGGKWRSRLGPDANKYILDQRERSQTVLHDGLNSLNELYLLTRQHYRQIITEVPGNWPLIFGPSFDPEPKDEVDRSLRLVFSLSDKDKHNLPNDFFLQNSDKVRGGLQAAARMVALMNGAYIRLLDSRNVVIENSEPGVTQVYFSFKQGSDRSNLTPIRIDSETGNRMALKLQKRLRAGTTEVDLNDATAVSGLLDGSYRDVLAVVVVARDKGYVSVNPGEGSRATLSLIEP